MTEKINYDVWGQRLHPCTVLLLKKCKRKRGKSWNLSLYDMAKKDLGEKESSKIINQYKKKKDV